MSEQCERLAQGERGKQGRTGNQGNRGEHGTAGLSGSIRKALVFLFVLNVVLAGANMLWTAHSVNANSRQRCASLQSDVSIPVPQPVAGNPSREFDAQLEAIDRHRLRQLHCTGD